MEKNFKSIQELTDYLNNKLIQAMDAVGKTALKHMREYVEKELKNREPNIYERTWEYLESIDRFEAWLHSDGSVRTEIYYNTDLIHPYLAYDTLGGYASTQTWNWHADFNNTDVSEYIPLFLEYGTNNPYYSHEPVGGIIDLEEWVKDNFKNELRKELNNLGIPTK